MPYSITTKDGITINNIPDNISKDDQSLKDRVAKLRGGNAQPQQEPQSQPATNKAPSLGNLRYGGNSYRDNNGAGLGSLAAGAVRGAGSIGATLLLPADMINQKMRGDDFFSMKDNNERRQAMTDGLETMGADTDSLMFKGGKLAGEIAGTAGIGGSAGGGITKIGGGNPLMNKIGNSVASGGLDLGVKGGSMLANGATRVGGGAINGALTAGAVDPESMGVGAVAGGALPVGVAGLGGAGKLFKGIAGNYSAANRAAGQGDDLLANAGQNPLQTIENLRNAQGATEGFNPTTWQAAGNADMAGFGRVMHGKEGGLLNERLVQQRQALADAVRKHGSDDLGSLTGTDLKREALEGARNSASEPFFNSAKDQAVQLTPELEALMQRPSMQQSVARAEKLVKEQGGNFNPADLNGRTAQSIKFGMDDLINTAPQSGIGSNEINAIRDTKADYLKQLGEQIPDYLKGNKAYAEASKPINQLDLGNEVTKRFIPAGQLDRAAPNELKYDALARALRNNGDQLARSVTGFKGSTLQNTAGEQQLKDYANVLSDTNYLKNADMGKMGGSSTYQNMELAKKANPLLSLAGSIPIKGVNASMLKAIKDKIYSPANKTYEQEIIQALLEPKTAAQLMEKQLTKKQVPSALIEALKNPAIRNALPLYLAQ